MGLIFHVCCNDTCKHRHVIFTQNAGIAPVSSHLSSITVGTVDFTHVTSCCCMQFMENWCYERQCLFSFAKHHESGEPLPEALYQKLVAARTFRAGSMMMRQVDFTIVSYAVLHTSRSISTTMLPEALCQKLIAAHTFRASSMMMRQVRRVLLLRGFEHWNPLLPAGVSLWCETWPHRNLHPPGSVNGELFVGTNHTLIPSCILWTNFFLQPQLHFSLLDLELHARYTPGGDKSVFDVDQAWTSFELIRPKMATCNCLSSASLERRPTHAYFSQWFTSMQPDCLSHLFISQRRCWPRRRQSCRRCHSTGLLQTRSDGVVHSLFQKRFTALPELFKCCLELFDGAACWETCS